MLLYKSVMIFDQSLQEKPYGETNLAGNTVIYAICIEKEISYGKIEKEVSFYGS